MPASRWDMGYGLARGGEGGGGGGTRACAYTHVGSPSSYVSAHLLVGVACPKGRRAVPYSDVPTVVGSSLYSTSEIIN